MTEVKGGEGEKPRTDLQESLHVTYLPGFSTVGHGTWLETAKESLKTGVQAKVPFIDTTAIPLFDTTKPYEAQIDDVIKLLSEWPHYNLPAISIIMLPNPDPDEPGGHRYFDGYFEELQGEDTGYNNRYVIPARYVRGYFDVQQKLFVENPDFNPIKKSYPHQANIPIKPKAQKANIRGSEVISMNQSSDEDVW
ncbi:hypothetical protein HYU45_03455 [Candidatus Daviesbacteria bacterium]|nr:hypothetical protein [Candidatus Daviesbacteria bacterium]